MKKFEYPNKLNIIFDKLNNFSIKPVLVGGFVRDFFLNIKSKDIDIELYNIDSLEKVEKILQEFGSVNSVGKSFGVVKLLYDDLDLDFSLPRKDSKIAQGHKGFSVSVDSHMDFKSAARRRDFTINAIGYDVSIREILNPYHGIRDLQNRVLQAVDLEKFGEDPLRVLRGVTFASRFELTIEKNLFTLSKEMIQQGVLGQLPRERIFKEIEKILLLSPHPSHAFKLLKNLSAFTFFSEFTTLDEEKFLQMLTALDNAKEISNSLKCPDKLTLLLAVLCSQFTHKQRQTFLEKLTQDKKLIHTVGLLTETLFDFEEVTNYTLYKVANKVKLNLYFHYLHALYPQKEQQIVRLRKKAQKLGILEKKLEPFLQGRDLIAAGLTPSKEFSNILSTAYELQMKEELKTKEEALEWLHRRVVLS
ncbi:CCA tRNA nucleotidyltransferase [Sulfurimonas paralvinellae]|uniref:CCA tRNA nucleotidyltransferase n=1 Tax=Sulfurimonas paralvinellae TaxID=317658 RepID=A0A7M1B4X5_9BACT|nr:CCA tRNA nucleotidyltransferase [Sulfurimonas paralvinellae]QOP44774.1 CCA tRNA nucleotidyltransferase [Sulfurimonas paralvinellae]